MVLFLPMAPLSPPQRDVICVIVSRSSPSVKRIRISRLIISPTLFFALSPRFRLHRLQWIPRLMVTRILNFYTLCLGTRRLALRSKQANFKSSRSSTRELCYSSLQPQPQCFSQSWGSGD